MVVHKKPAMPKHLVKTRINKEKEKKTYLCPLSKCMVCKGPLHTDAQESAVPCTIVTSESFDEGYTVRKRCRTKGGCISTYRTNFAYVDSVKVNTMSFKQMEEFGVYMVTNSFGFSMKYLELSYLRLLRGNLAPGQEGSVRLLSENGKPIHAQRFQSHLLKALEGYALSKRTPDQAIPFPVDNPSSYEKFSSKPFTFHTPSKVQILSFDGHFGVHRRLNPEWGEEPRTIRPRGRPRTKKYGKDQRTCTCAHKDRQRITKANRTAGWQFVIDPQSRRVVAAKEHIVNETCADKVDAVQAAMALPKVHANALIHDDACHFQNYVQRRQSLKKTFRSIQHTIVDEFHRPNHKCRKAQLTRSEAKRFRGIRTNMSEVFNSWMRRKNFFLNGMKGCSHRFWVCESIRFWNANLRAMPSVTRRRTTAETRNR